MALPQALVTFPGINQIVEFEYTLAHGISPGVATITLVPQRGWPAKVGNLVLSYDNEQMALKGFVPDSLSFQIDRSGMLWRLNLLDRRVNWRYGQISGMYNSRLPHGPVDKLDPRNEKKPIELLKKCLEAMKETNYIIAERALPNLRPNVYWDYSNPAQELAILCDTFGMRICLLPDNRVAILPKGKGGLDGNQVPSLPNGPIVQDSGTYDPPERPARIVFVCGATRTQVDLALDAYGDDIDGLVKPINDLTYKPPGGWEKAADIVHFTGVPRTPNSIDINQAWNTLCNPRELAKQSIYKKYRVTIYGVSGRAVTPPGFKDKLKDIRQLMPFGTQLLEPTFDPDTGWYRPVNTIIWGAFARGNKNNYEPTQIELSDGRTAYLPIPIVQPKIDPVTGQKLTKWDTTVIPPDEFSIDQDTGIITFNRRILRYENSTDIKKQVLRPAVLFVRTAVTVSDDVKFTVKREEFYRELKNPSSTQYAYVKDDDLFVRYVPSFYNKGDHSSSTGKTDNLETVKKYAKERLDAEERKYMVKGPRHVRYAGWKRINPDGAVQQVCWSMGIDGAFTDASLNDEIAVVTVPYSERRFLEKAQNDRTAAAIKMADNLAAERAYAFSKASGLARTQR